MPVSQPGVIQKSGGGGGGAALSALLQTAGMIADISNQMQTLKLRREENLEQTRQFGVTSGFDERQIAAQEGQLQLGLDQLKNQQYQDAKGTVLKQQNDVIANVYGGSLKVWAGFNAKDAKIRSTLMADGDVTKAQEYFEAWRAAEPTPAEREMAQQMTYQGQFYLENGPDGPVPTNGQQLSDEDLAKARGIPIVDENLVSFGFGSGGQSGFTPMSWQEDLGMEASPARVQSHQQTAPQASAGDLWDEAFNQRGQQKAVSETEGRWPATTNENASAAAPTVTAARPAAQAPVTQTQTQMENDRLVGENLAKLQGLSSESMAEVGAVVQELRKRSAELSETGDAKTKRLLQDFTDAQKKTVYTLRRDLTPEQKEMLQFMHMDGDAQAAVLTKIASVPYQEWNRVEQTMLYPEEAKQVHKDEFEARRVAAAIGVDIENLKLQNSQQKLQAASLGLEEYWNQMSALAASQGDDSEIGRIWTELNNLFQQQQDDVQFWEKEYGADWQTNKRVQEGTGMANYKAREKMINQLLPVLGFNGTFEDVEYIQTSRRARGIPVISWGIEQVFGPKTSTGTRTEYVTGGTTGAQQQTADEAAAAAWAAAHP